MTLIGADQAEALYDQVVAETEMSGGSAANTIAGLASMGGRGAFIGKVRNDELGAIFRRDIRSLGVRFDTPPATSGAGTARCLVLVTDDAERTMNTYLGACVGLETKDVDVDLIRAAQVTYLEGYLWDPPSAKSAFRKAMQIAHGAQRLVALTLSDPFCVDRYRTEFVQLVAESVDILFANEKEIISLYEAKDLEDAVRQVRGHCKVAALTLGARGSIVLSGSQVHVVDPAPVDRLVDTTGAGDLYAAGFLFGYTAGHDLAICGTYGSKAAAEVISHYGARPNTPLIDLVVS
ncbi:MAG TPA: adenosine kinase [Alphaproteobacteria bacterium]|nr:adenosine kinase [Alphaproteobacteria bacterium]